MRNIKTREGYDYWDKLCAIPSYGFIHSPDNSRILKAEGLGNWIDQHAAQEVVDAAQDEINDLRARLAQLEQQTQWISVEERLPSIAQEVIVNTEFEGVCAGVLDSYMEWYAPCSDYKLTRVTHWLPLPSAPTP